jgi:enterochelin esterase-like enzyme
VFSSVTLGLQMPYTVYLPAGYDQTAPARYPVLYMLHGVGGQKTEWEGYRLLETADRLIATREIEPLLIVLPQGDQSYWVDWADGGPAWGRYTAREVVQRIDATYRTLAEPRSRAVGGLSMGAHGALQLALSYPGVFGVVGAHSPSLRSFDARLPYFGDQAYFSTHDPLQLVQAQPERARPLQLWLDVGADDGWYSAVAELHTALDRAGVGHVWRVYAGGHDGPYWTAHAADYLRFYAAALRSEPARGGTAQLPVHPPMYHPMLLVRLDACIGCSEAAPAIRYEQGW